MAGTLTISILSDGTNSTSSTNCSQGSAKAWVNFNGSSGAIRTSYNVSSVTRTGTGDYTVNFTSAFADANYSILAVGSMGAGYSEPRIMGNTTTSPTTTSCRLLAYNLTGGSVFDPVIACAAFFR